MSSIPTYGECTQSSLLHYTFVASKAKQTPSSHEFPFDIMEDHQSAISIPFDMESFESNLYLSPALAPSLLYDAVPNAVPDAVLDAATPSTIPSNDETSPSCITDDTTSPAYSSQSSPGPHTPIIHTSEVESEPHKPPTIEYTSKRTSPCKGIIHNQRPSGPTPALKCNWEGCTYKGSFKRRYDLRRHVRTLHTSPKSYVCPEPECEGKRVFNRKDGLQNHNRRYHSVARAPACKPSPRVMCAQAGVSSGPIGHYSGFSDPQRWGMGSRY